MQNTQENMYQQYQQYGNPEPNAYTIRKDMFPVYADGSVLFHSPSAAEDPHIYSYSTPHVMHSMTGMTQRPARKQASWENERLAEFNNSSVSSPLLSAATAMVVTAPFGVNTAQPQQPQQVCSTLQMRQHQQMLREGVTNHPSHRAMYNATSSSSSISASKPGPVYYFPQQDHFPMMQQQPQQQLHSQVSPLQYYGGSPAEPSPGDAFNAYATPPRPPLQLQQSQQQQFQHDSSGPACAGGYSQNYPTIATAVQSGALSDPTHQRFARASNGKSAINSSVQQQQQQQQQQHLQAGQPRHTAAPGSAGSVAKDLLDKLEQSGKVPSKEKFRKMVCLTFVMTGACPYNDRCVFMHDYRATSPQPDVRVRSTRPVKVSNAIKDTFYWPDMTNRDICQQLDAQGLPDTNQRYIIPASFSCAGASYHNRGIYSMWTHFVEFCTHNAALVAQCVVRQQRRQGQGQSQEYGFEEKDEGSLYYQQQPLTPYVSRSFSPPQSLSTTNSSAGSSTSCDVSHVQRGGVYNAMSASGAGSRAMGLLLEEEESGYFNACRDPNNRHIPGTCRLRVFLYLSLILQLQQTMRTPPLKQQLQQQQLFQEQNLLCNPLLRTAGPTTAAAVVEDASAYPSARVAPSLAGTVWTPLGMGAAPTSSFPVGLPSAQLFPSSPSPTTHISRHGIPRCPLQGTSSSINHSFTASSQTAPPGSPDYFVPLDQRLVPADTEAHAMSRTRTEDFADTDTFGVAAAPQTPSTAQLYGAAVWGTSLYAPVAPTPATSATAAAVVGAVTGRQAGQASLCADVWATPGLSGGKVVDGPGGNAVWEAMAATHTLLSVGGGSDKLPVTQAPSVIVPSLLHHANHPVRQEQQQAQSLFGVSVARELFPPLLGDSSLTDSTAEEEHLAAACFTVVADHAAAHTAAAQSSNMSKSSDSVVTNAMRSAAPSSPPPHIEQAAASTPLGGDDGIIEKHKLRADSQFYSAPAIASVGSASLTGPAATSVEGEGPFFCPIFPVSPSPAATRGAGAPVAMVVSPPGAKVGGGVEAGTGFPVVDAPVQSLLMAGAPSASGSTCTAGVESAHQTRLFKPTSAFQPLRTSAATPATDMNNADKAEAGGEELRLTPDPFATPVTRSSAAELTTTNSAIVTTDTDSTSVASVDDNGSRGGGLFSRSCSISPILSATSPRHLSPMVIDTHLVAFGTGGDLDDRGADGVCGGTAIHTRHEQIASDADAESVAMVADVETDVMGSTGTGTGTGTGPYEGGAGGGGGIGGLVGHGFSYAINSLLKFATPYQTPTVAAPAPAEDSSTAHAVKKTTTKPPTCTIGDVVAGRSSEAAAPLLIVNSSLPQDELDESSQASAALAFLNDAAAGIDAGAGRATTTTTTSSNVDTAVVHAQACRTAIAMSTVPLTPRSTFARRQQLLRLHGQELSAGTGGLTPRSTASTPRGTVVVAAPTATPAVDSAAAAAVAGVGKECSYGEGDENKQATSTAGNCTSIGDWQNCSSLATQIKLEQRRQQQGSKVGRAEGRAAVAAVALAGQKESDDYAGYLIQAPSDAACRSPRHSLASTAGASSRRDGIGFPRKGGAGPGCDVLLGLNSLLAFAPSSTTRTAASKPSTATYTTMGAAEGYATEETGSHKDKRYRTRHRPRISRGQGHG